MPGYCLRPQVLSVPQGIVVVGGVLFSTFLALLIVPVVYSYLARFTIAERIQGDDTPEQGLALEED